MKYEVYQALFNYTQNVSFSSEKTFVDFNLTKKQISEYCSYAGHWVKDGSIYYQLKAGESAGDKFRKLSPNKVKLDGFDTLGSQTRGV